MLGRNGKGNWIGRVKPNFRGPWEIGWGFYAVSDNDMIWRNGAEERPIQQIREFNMGFKYPFTLPSLSPSQTVNSLVFHHTESSLLINVSLFFSKIKEILGISSWTPSKCLKTSRNEQLLVSQSGQAILEMLLTLGQNLCSFNLHSLMPIPCRTTLVLAISLTVTAEINAAFQPSLSKNIHLL